MNSGEARTPNLVAVESAGLDFRWCHAHLRKGLSDGDRGRHQTRGSDYEPLDRGSDKQASTRSLLRRRVRVVLKVLRTQVDDVVAAYAACLEKGIKPSHTAFAGDSTGGLSVTSQLTQSAD
jgi:hypothetical protein